MSESTQERMNDASMFDVVLSASDDKPFFNSVDTVEEFIRGFVAEALKARGAARDGKVSMPDALKQFENLAKSYSKVVLGKSDAYTFDKWNSAPYVGAHCHAALKSEKSVSNDVAVFIAFINLGVEAFQVSDASVTANDDDWQAGIDDIVERYTHLFTGIPYPDAAADAV